MRSLSRGRREGEGSPLLVVTPASQHPPPAGREVPRARLCTSGCAGAGLDGATPGAGAGAADAPVGGSGGEVLESFLGHPLELTQFLRMAIGLAVALGRLHGPGVSFTRTSRRQYSR